MRKLLGMGVLRFAAVCCPAACGFVAPAAEPNGPAPQKELHVMPTDDFELTGDGAAAAWKDVAWEPMSRRDAGKRTDTRASRCCIPRRACTC